MKIITGKKTLIYISTLLCLAVTLFIGSIPDMISVVSADPGAIGYETLWMAHHRYKQKGRVKALKIDGYAPNEFNYLISGRYPLYRVFSITTWEGKNVANPHAQNISRPSVTRVRESGQQIRHNSRIPPKESRMEI